MIIDVLIIMLGIGIPVAIVIGTIAAWHFYFLTKDNHDQ